MVCRALAIAAVAATVIFLRAPARAADDTPHTLLMIGPFLAASTGQGTVIGGEVSVHHFLDESDDDSFRLGMGGFVQADPRRAALGFQITHAIVGLEVGFAGLAGDATHAASLAFHLAPFLSIGVISVSVRLEPSLVRFGSGASYGPDAGAMVTLKLPIGLDGSADAFTRVSK